MRHSCSRKASRGSAACSKGGGLQNASIQSSAGTSEDHHHVDALQDSIQMVLCVDISKECLPVQLIGMLHDTLCHGESVMPC